MAEHTIDAVSIVFQEAIVRAHVRAPAQFQHLGRFQRRTYIRVGPDPGGRQDMPCAGRHWTPRDDSSRSRGASDDRRAVRMDGPLEFQHD
jgi:hypothetical protein